MSCGPRLSSFLLDTSEEEALDVSDASKYVPLGRDQTLQLCGYPVHDLSTAMLQQLPPNVVFNEYGVKVGVSADPSLFSGGQARFLGSYFVSLAIPKGLTFGYISFKYCV